MSIPKASRTLLVTALLAATFSSSAHAAKLSSQLPAGALLTLETHDAGGAFDRLTGLVSSITKSVGGKDGENAMAGISSMQQVLKSSIGKEAVVGLFAVGNAKQTFTPEVLAVTRVDEFSSEFFKSMLPQQAGAKVGSYPISRQNDMFVGQAKGLVYLSTNKTLLMNYLGRLSGNTAPRLINSPSYSTPTNAVGKQELSVFLNFSGMAKVARSQLSQIMLPRLLSPIVDAVDTLGSYSAGFTTTKQGLTALSAHAANNQGKDQPLYKVLTHTADFDVQNLIPASVESAVASACAPESSAYAARWLTRFDLLDPVGFLTDSQLSSYMEQSSRYLGDECAQVTLAGGMMSSFDSSNPLRSLDYSVTYQKVSDMAAAQAALPKYAASVNTAIAGVSKTLSTMMNQANLSGLQKMDDSQSTMGAMMGMASSIKQINAALGHLKMVYVFKDGYLITAFSQKALTTALAENAPKLANDPKFMASGSNLSKAAGWQYAPAPQKVTSAQIMNLYAKSLSQSQIPEMPEMKEMLKPLSAATADLINRYGGMNSQSSVSGNLVISRSNVAFNWKQ